MSATAELATRVRFSDPRPDRCSACFQGADASSRFVDMDAAADRGSLVLEDGVSVVGSIDDIHLCEACVRAAAEVVAFKPELHRKQLNANQRLDLRVKHWRATAGRYQREIDLLKEYITQLEAEKGGR